MCLILLLFVLFYTLLFLKKNVYSVCSNWKYVLISSLSHFFFKSLLDRTVKKQDGILEGLPNKKRLLNTEVFLVDCLF